MAATQDLFEKALEQIALDQGLRLVIDRNYSNTGRYTILPATEFTPILRIEHNWQSGGHNGGYLMLEPKPWGAVSKGSWGYDELDELQREIVRFLDDT